MLVNESETCKNGVLNPGYGMRGGTIMRDGAAYFLEFKGHRNRPMGDGLGSAAPVPTAHPSPTFKAATRR